MPQWNRDRGDIADGAEEWWIAECSREDAIALVGYDHHVATVDGRQAVLITYEWRDRALPDQGKLYFVKASFADPHGHPTAPAPVQVIVDRLKFRPWDGVDRRA